MLPSSASRTRQLIHKVQHGLSPVELVYSDHERWPLQPGEITNTRPVLHISILDASFNPPTLAHLALANSHPPPLSQYFSATSASAESYNARMLLLSVRNVDKVLKTGDATLVQRLEMMHLLSHDIYSTNTTEPESESLQDSGNVAVAVIDEPTFVRKSTALLRFLQTRLATLSVRAGIPGNRDPFPSPKLTFLLGFDTLIRLFSPKYYPSQQVMSQMLRSFLSPDEDSCRIVCAFRQNAGIGDTPEAAREFIANDRIAFIDIGTEEQTYSSSQARTSIAVGDDRWKRLVTDAIANYIVKQGIYSGSERRQ